MSKISSKERRGNERLFRAFSYFFIIHRSSILMKIILDNSSSCHGDAKGSYKIYERRNYVLYDGEEKERRMRKKRKRMSKRTNRPFPPKGRKNRLKYSTRSLGGRSNEEEILKKNLLRVSQLRGNTEPFARSAI